MNNNLDNHICIYCYCHCDWSSLTVFCNQPPVECPTW